MREAAIAFRFNRDRRGRHGDEECEPEELQQGQEKLYRVEFESVMELQVRAKYNTSKGNPEQSRCPVIDEQCLPRLKGQAAILYPDDDVRRPEPPILLSRTRIAQLFMDEKCFRLDLQIVLNKIQRDIHGLRRMLCDRMNCQRRDDVSDEMRNDRWERTIRTIERWLHAAIVDRVRTDEVLLRIMIQSEWVTNQHPPAHAPLESGTEPVLNPNDHLHGGLSRMRVGPGRAALDRGSRGSEGITSVSIGGPTQRQCPKSRQDRFLGA